MIENVRTSKYYILEVVYLIKIFTVKNLYGIKGNDKNIKFYEDCNILVG